MIFIYIPVEDCRQDSLDLIFRDFSERDPCPARKMNIDNRLFGTKPNAPAFHDVGLDIVICQILGDCIEGLPGACYQSA